VVSLQPSQPMPSVAARLAAPLLHAGPSAPLLSGAAIRVVEGGRGALLTVRAVAGRLGVSAATVYALCSRGDLAHVRVSNAIRVRPEDLASYVARSRA
jgi:excisionase family DNA binding protein